MRVPADFSGTATIAANGTPPAGELYDSVNDAFAPGEVLHCSGLRGMTVVTITTTGAKTGQKRSTDLIGIREGPSTWMVVASFAGGIQHPAWYFNMAAHPDGIWIKDGGRQVRVDASSLKGDEADAAYARFVAIWPGYAGYKKKTDREIPVVRLTATG